MNEIRVSNWNELNEALYHDSWKESLRRFRSDHVYRGMSDASEELTTGLLSLGEGCMRLERPLLRNFRKYAQRDAVPGDWVWNWLALAQHHGLPTRLLDWTYSPFVAAHFATHNLERFDVDGVIWCVNHVHVKEHLPAELKAILDEEDSFVFTTELLNQAADTLEALDRLAEAEFVVFLEPPSFDERIVNQFSVFSLMSSPTARLDLWLDRHPELFYRVIIPAQVKWEVRDKLDQANLNERVLFPGLDGLGRWLKRYYTSRAS